MATIKLFIGGGSGFVEIEVPEVPSPGGGAPPSVLTYQPGGTDVPPSQFTSWTALYAEFLKTVGPVLIAIDVTFAPSATATIDAGTWDMQGRATLTASGLNAQGGAELAIPDGSVLKNLTAMTGPIQLDTASATVPPLQWDGKPFADFTVSNFAAFLQRGAAPVMRVAAGQTFYLTLDGNIEFNSFPGGFGALVDLSDATSTLALSALSGLFLFPGPPGNVFSGVAGSRIAYLYDASWPGNPLNPSFAGIYNAPTVIDSARFVAYTPAVPGNWPVTPTQVAQALDELAAVTGHGDPNAIAFFGATGKLTDNPQFIVDDSDPNNLRLFINQTGPIPYPPDTPSGAGIQYSTNVANRASARLSQYGSNAGIPNLSFFKSRGVAIGQDAACQDGDVLMRLTCAGVTGNGIAMPLAGLLSFVIPVGGTFPQSISPDLEIQQAVGTINSRRPTWVFVGLTGDLKQSFAGQRIRIKEGANAMQGVAVTGAGGTIAVPNTLITASTRISLTWQDGGSVPAGTPYVASRVAGTSFTVQSTNPADAGVNVFWQLWEPAP